MTKSIAFRLPIALSLLLGGLLFAAAPAYAQAVTTSSFTIPVSGTASAVKTGLAETVAFSGSVIVIATVVNDPTLGPTVALWVDGIGLGQKERGHPEPVSSHIVRFKRLWVD